METHSVRFIPPAGVPDNYAPLTLPVLFLEEKIALAILQLDEYLFTLPEPTCEMLSSGTHVARFVYLDEYGQYFWDHESGRRLAAIQLMSADAF